MQVIACPLCGSEQATPAIQENGYTGQCCAHCGLIYISPRPSPEEIALLYSHDGAYTTAERRIARETAARLYARHNLSIIHRYVQVGKMLEIGAGAGFFLDEARKTGFDPYAIELNTIQAGYMSRLEIPCETVPLSHQSYGGQMFDIIYHADVISHFYDPIAEFRNMHDRLNDDGWLVFETGNGGDMDNRYYKYIGSFQYPDHLFLFSTRNIVDLLAQTGFRLIAEYHYNILPELILRSVRRGRGRSNSHPVSHASSVGHNSLARQAWMRLIYYLRYSVGAILPMGGYPQTVVYVAHKS